MVGIGGGETEAVTGLQARKRINQIKGYAIMYLGREFRGGDGEATGGLNGDDELNEELVGAVVGGVEAGGLLSLDFDATGGSRENSWQRR